MWVTDCRKLLLTVVLVWLQIDVPSLGASDYSPPLVGQTKGRIAEPGQIGISLSGHYVMYRGDPILLIDDSGTQCAAQNGNLNHRAWIDDCDERGIRAIHLWSFVPVRQQQDGSLDLSATAGKKVNCRFYNPRDGQFGPRFQRVAGPNPETFIKPSAPDWVLHVIQE